MIRPELAERLTRHREPIAAGAVMLAGLWIATRGGPVFAGLGVLVALAGAALLLPALRRLRFGGGTAPGIIELDEGRVGYFGPEGGGFVDLAELAEIRAVDLGERRFWRLRTVDGQALLVPMRAEGAERLYDTLAALPGADPAALAAAAGAPVRPGTLQPPLWRRPASG
ncbi:hypothetical protein [Frigidibacter sp. MR17.24]|uniref:hypothetical protein n=1 Tax=Frigidibacter sp. MR17.24 TaxID=3127345 RepID=UPI003012FB4B